MDKSEAIITFLQSCPTIQNNPLFFNFGNVTDNGHQVNTESDDRALEKPYIDGSVLKRFTFSIDSFKSVTYNAIIQGYSAENVEEFQNIQSIIDWINTQDKLRNFPVFETTDKVDKIKTKTLKPELVGVDTSLNPPVAIYRITIQVDYIDKSECLWH